MKQFRVLFPALMLTFCLSGNVCDAQDNSPEHKGALRLDLRSIIPTHSTAFENNMNGVWDVNLAYHQPFAKNLLAGIGIRYSSFESAEDEPLTREIGGLQIIGPFLKAGYQPYITDRFFIETSLKVGYRHFEYYMPNCKAKNKAPHHIQDAFDLEPQFGFNWNTGEGLSFGAIVGYNLIRAEFDPSILCTDRFIPEENADGNYRSWTFGFSVTAEIAPEN